MTESSFEIAGGDYERGGLATKGLKEQLKQIGVAPEVLRRVMIAAYEAEMNAVIHGGGGSMKAVLDDKQVCVEVADHGPGIADVGLALTEGFSTAPAAARELGFGAGMGLPNIRRCSDRFSLESAPGQGTTVRFTIRLRPMAPAAAKPTCLHIRSQACTGCYRCLHACPTLALRVRVEANCQARFSAQVQALEYLCVDCTSCMAACPRDALSLAPTQDEIQPSADTVLLAPPAFVAQFAPATTADVLAALRQLGFGDVIFTGPAEAALRLAVREMARGADETAHTDETSVPRAGETPATQRNTLPLISPVCPAVLNLIETKFPAVIGQVAPFLSPLESLREELTGRRAACVVLCPAQKSLLAQGRGPEHFAAILPSQLEAKLRPLLKGSRAKEALPAAPAQSPDVLRVCGMAHVVRVLEEMENGQFTDPGVLELYGCDEGCLGSPLLRQDAFISSRRQLAEPAVAETPKPLARTQPLAARPGLRLDADMAKAVRKLAQIDRLIRRLPGHDCGLCGSPTCASLAQDVVLGRAAATDCCRQQESRS